MKYLICRHFLSTLTSMKMRAVLSICIFSLFLSQVNILTGGEKNRLYYALPRGYPFTKSSFISQNDKRVLLTFAERLDTVSMAVREDVLWYHIRKGEYMFFLPEPFVVASTDPGPYDDNGNLVIGHERVDRENSVSLFYRPSDLVLLPERYRARGYEDRTLLLRKQASQAFIRMIDDADKEGICIRVISAFRDARYQSFLYERAIDRYGPVQGAVAKPGHSEHQLGTTCDLTTDEIGYDLNGTFESTAAFEWLKKNSYRYGITHSYPKHKQRITGYIYEPWHFRYWGDDRWTPYIDRMGLFFSR